MPNKNASGISARVGSLEKYASLRYTSSPVGHAGVERRQLSLLLGISIECMYCDAGDRVERYGGRQTNSDHASND